MVPVVFYHLLWYQLYCTIRIICYGTSCIVPFAMVQVVLYHTYHLLWYQLYCTIRYGTSCVVLFAMVPVVWNYLLWYKFYRTICYGTNCILPFAMVPVVIYHLIWYQLYFTICYGTSCTLALCLCRPGVTECGWQDDQIQLIPVSMSLCLRYCCPVSSRSQVLFMREVFRWVTRVSIDCRLLCGSRPPRADRVCTTGSPGLYDGKSGSVRPEVKSTKGVYPAWMTSRT